MKSLVTGAPALARIGGAWEPSSYEPEATSAESVGNRLKAPRLMLNTRPPARALQL